jgi:hypothetical protein
VTGRNLGDARIRKIVFRPHSEMEGWIRQPDGREVYVTSSPMHNIQTGKTRLVDSFATPRGAWGFTPEEDAEFARRFRGKK